ncbi:hypothetical protein D3C78_1906080 [compost metagenome]
MRLNICSDAFQLTTDHLLNLIKCHATDELSADIRQGEHALCIDSRFQLSATARERSEQG